MYTGPSRIHLHALLTWRLIEIMWSCLYMRADCIIISVGLCLVIVRKWGKSTY